MVASAASSSAVRAPRRWPDCEAMTTAEPPGDDPAEHLEHQGGAVEVDAQDQLWRCLGRRDSGGMDDTGHLTQAGGVFDQRLHRLPRRDVDGGGAGLEAGVLEHLGGGVRVLGAEVGDQDALSGTDSSGDGHTDRAGSDDDGDVGHDVPCLSCRWPWSIGRSSAASPGVALAHGAYARGGVLDAS